MLEYVPIDYMLAVLDDMLFVIMAAIYAFALYSAYRILISPLTASARIAWTLAFAIAPIVSVPLYYLFGQNRLRKYMRKAIARGEEFSHSKITPARYPLPSDHPLEVVFRNISQTFGSQSNEVQLLIDGQRTFTAIFDTVARAKSYIFVQYYILRSDRLGLELQRLLIDRARSGVMVYVLYDEVGCFWLSKQYLNDMKKEGVLVAPFLPLRSINRGLQLNFRNHRKLVIVDGHTAFTGGLNVGEEYVGKTKFAADWRDTHIMIHGASVLQLEDLFLEDWYFATGHTIQIPKRTTDVGTHRGIPCRIQVIPTGPTDPVDLGLYLFMQIIQSARRRLWVATPYLIPDPTLVRELELAHLRGVDVRFLLPQHPDHKIVHWVSMFYGELLQRKGLKVFLYRAGFMHQKVALVDDDVAIIGTTNFDNRAIYLNFEMTLVIHGKDFAEEVASMLEADFARAIPLEQEKDPVVRIIKRLRTAAARLLEPLL